MESSRPSSQPSPEDRELLEGARGDLRDALGSVRNLVQLLHSMRVGPKAISAVLPAVHGACEPIETSMRVLLEVIAARLPTRRAADELLSWSVPRANQIERELARAIKKPMNARTRLDLEHVVTRVSRELDAARALIDLLDDAVRGSAVRLETAELIREASRSRETILGPTAYIPVHVEKGIGGEVLANPRVAMALLGVGARLVAQTTAQTPFVASTTESPHTRALVMTNAVMPGDDIMLAAPPIFPPTLAVAEAAALVSGARLEWNDGTARFSLTWSG